MDQPPMIPVGWAYSDRDGKWHLCADRPSDSGGRRKVTRVYRPADYDPDQTPLSGTAASHPRGRKKP